VENNSVKNNLSIAHFSWEFPPAIWGGLGTFIMEISKKQAAYGNKVSVFAINDHNKLPTSEQWNGVEVFRPKVLDITSSCYIFSNHDLQSWGKYYRFFSTVLSYSIMSADFLVDKLVRQNGRSYNLIDAHDWLGILGGIISKNELDLPLFFHVHSTESGRSGGGGSETLKNIELMGGETADCVITVSYAMSEELKKLGFPKDKIKVCWNGIDPNKYDPSKISKEEVLKLRRSYGVLDNEHLLFFIGRLVTIKGVENLVKALPMVLDEFPNVKLLILGVGELEERIRFLMEKLQIKDRVILRTEFVDEHERILHYAAADTVVLPSLYEPFGIVCTEAMSMAKPVVVGARGTSGMREQIVKEGEEQCGIHMNPYDPADIAWGIKQVLSSDDEGKWMGKNGRLRVIKNYSWDVVANKTLDIYKEFAKK
jgi:glycogen(starch) synthase